MKAWRIEAFGPLENAVYGDFPDPVPGDGEVLIDVAAASVNFPDLLMMQGQYQTKPALPFVPGRDAAGIIAALGKGVHNLRVGDRVATMAVHGAFASRLAVPASRCYPIPDDLGFDAAAAMVTVYATVLVALHKRAKAQPGERVLVLGAGGGVGIATVSYARLLGCRVVAVVSSAEKQALVQEAGADAVIVAKDADSMRAEVLKWSGNAGVDVAIDPVGGDMFDAALRCMAPQGRLVVVGFAAGRIPTIRANYILLKDIAVMGSSLERWVQAEPMTMAKDIGDIFKAGAAGRLPFWITDRLKIEDGMAAFRAIAERTARGKIVLEIGAPMLKSP
ncbi:MAG: NADPH:quinone oxidoreductase family protein [Proteobacteria bacterium]|nr:NADPH:quinone oxidoreductase family protein [Pseudomonadota bacterium]